MKKVLIAAAILAGSAGTAFAGGTPNTVGVGAEVTLSGLGGVSVNYDAGRFHAGGFVSFSDPDGPNNTEFELGGRFFYHVASTASADFSVGGSVGVENQGNGNANGSTTVVVFEPSFQIRAFIVPNVALSFTGGFSFTAGDTSAVLIDGEVTGIAGVHYYFN
jgi:hypothetical protein